MSADSRCNACHRPGHVRLKLGFFPRQPNVGGFRVSLTVEAEGAWCPDCVGRIERETKFGNFSTVCPPGVRAEIATVFSLRGWGEPNWDEISVEWIREGKDRLLSAPFQAVEDA